MPTYDYECQACGNRLEVTQRITEAALVDCPACHAPKLQRIISAAAFMLKGGGWYKDGYSTSGPGKPRTENDRIDRLSKAIDDDKKKTAAESAGASDTSSSTSGASDASASTSTASSGSSSSGGSSA